MSLKKRVGASKLRLAGLASSLGTIEGQGDGQEGALQQSRSTDFLLALCLLGPLSVLAELLIVKTHHRPLGAATYASIALLSWMGVGLLVRTLVVGSRSAKEAAHARSPNIRPADSEGPEGTTLQAEVLDVGSRDVSAAPGAIESNSKLRRPVEHLPQPGTTRIGSLRMALWLYGLLSSAGAFLRALLG